MCTSTVATGDGLQHPVFSGSDHLTLRISKDYKGQKRSVAKDSFRPEANNHRALSADCFRAIAFSNDRCYRRRPRFAAERRLLSQQHAPLVLDAPMALNPFP
ncbi:hypothetical protein D3C86_647530 [compost metagenome]